VTENLLVWLASVPAWASAAALMLLSALENVFPPVPADVAVACGAFLAQRAGRSALLLGTLCWLANCVSAAGVYAFARARGPGFVERGLGRRLMPPVALAAIRAAYARHGALGIFLSRFLPGLRAGVLPFAGIVGLTPLRALTPALLSSAIWYALIVAAATLFGLSWPALRSLLERANALLALLALAAVALVGFSLWRKSTRR
jgi:membrane protein DedA with SNARE-associated domain